MTTQAPPAVGTFCWNELATRDVAAAKKFYATLLGWTSNEMPMPTGTYTMFMQGETMVGGMYEMNGPQFEGVPPHWLSYINVADIEAKTKEAESLGATVHMPPTEVPNMGTVSVLADPTGAAIALWQPAGGC